MLSTLLTHPALLRYIKLNSTTIGRDRQLRSLSDLARLTLYVLSFRPANCSTRSLEARLLGFRVQILLTRKIQRFGRFLDFVVGTNVVWKSKETDAFLKICGLGAQVGYAGFMFFDHLTLIDSLNISRYKPDLRMRLARLSLKFWLAALCCTASRSVYQLYLLQPPTGNTKHTGEEKATALTRTQLRLALLMDLCDSTLVIPPLGIANLHEGFACAAALTSSTLSLRRVWSTVAL